RASEAKRRVRPGGLMTRSQHGGLNSDKAAPSWGSSYSGTPCEICFGGYIRKLGKFGRSIISGIGYCLNGKATIHVPGLRRNDVLPKARAGRSYFPQGGGGQREVRSSRLDLHL